MCHPITLLTLAKLLSKNLTCTFSRFGRFWSSKFVDPPADACIPALDSYLFSRGIWWLYLVISKKKTSSQRKGPTITLPPIILVQWKMLVSPMSISFHSPGGFPLNHDSRAVKVNPFSLRSSLFEVIRGGPQL